MFNSHYRFTQGTNSSAPSSRRQSEFHCYAVSKQLNQLLIGNGNDGIVILSLNDFQVIKTIQPSPSYCLTSMALTKNGKKLATWNNFGSIDLVDLETFSSERIVDSINVNEKHFPRWSGNIVGFIDDSTLLINILGSRLAYFDINNQVITCYWQFDKHYNELNIVDNLLIGSAGSSRCVDIYNVDSKELVHSIQAEFPVYTARMHENHVYYAGFSSSVFRVDLNTKTINKEYKTDGREIHAFTFTPDHKYLLVAQHSGLEAQKTSGKKYEGSLCIFDVSTQVQINRFNCGEFVSMVLIDSRQNIITIASYGDINLFHYNQNGIPSLQDLARSAISKIPNFFEPVRVFERNQGFILEKYFDVHVEEQEDLAVDLSGPK